MASDDDLPHRGSQGISVPLLLIIGEVLLGLAIFRYTVCFLTGAVVGWYDTMEMIASISMMVFNLAMLLLTADSIIGIASARPSSWRKVMRSSIILVSISLLYDFLEGIGIDYAFLAFQDYLIVPVVAVTILIMMLPSVRRFYTPPLAEMPPLKSWIGYIFFWPLLPRGTYRFSKGDSADKEESAPE